MGLGTAPLGGLYETVDEGKALATLERAYELGIRYFDTAPLYGHGLAETRTGRVLRGYPRNDITLSTKVGRLLRPGEPDPDGQFKGTPKVVPIFDFSYDAVMRSFEESLQRLGIDQVDILYIHDPDDHYEAARDGAFPALARLRNEGVVRAIGAGMNQSEMLARFARETDMDCFLLAGRYTLLEQGALRELLPLCQERHIAIVIGGVFNSDLLANPRPGAHFNYEPASDELLARAQKIAQVCARWDVPLKAAALQFPMGHPTVSSVLVGVRSIEHLEEDLGLFELEIPDGLWAELKERGLLDEAAPVPTSRLATR
ncbi:MAG TPA: aldo/keto reductase [Candidatus Acidoferrum sp.]|nr:aldo/keto reductase [Candidatus Acidoferrum sp.]